MDGFAKLSSDQRRPFFEQAAARLGISAQIIEKDFWVVWSLKRLFSLPEFQGQLTFKGGTSLSKVYRIIERFSEDVDVAIDRAYLGFGGDMQPENAKGKEQSRRIKKLKAACQAVITERISPQLETAIGAELPEDGTWSLTPDPADPDQQSLLFEFPATITSGLAPYFARSIKIEMEARSDHFPVEDADLTAYVADALPDAIVDKAVRVRVLEAKRTFWEKATILHAHYHEPEGKKLPARLSRHYYDVFQLANSSVLDRALESHDILARVVAHKTVFFKAAWANYKTASRGTMRLVPPDRLVTSLRQDYEDMQPMFFGEAPTFDAILRRLQELEDHINRY